jgi:hypothetical protein
MQYSSIVGWKSSYKSVPANPKLRNTSVYSMHTSHMKQNIAAITECGGCGGALFHIPPVPVARTETFMFVELYVCRGMPKADSLALYTDKRKYSYKGHE